MTAILWSEDNEFVGFEEAPDLDWAARLEGNATAAIIMNGLYKLTEPIWLQPSTAAELAEAGILLPWQAVFHGPQVTTELRGVTVYLYQGPF